MEGSSTPGGTPSESRCNRGETRGNTRSKRAGTLAAHRSQRILKGGTLFTSLSAGEARGKGVERLFSRGGKRSVDLPGGRLCFLSSPIPKASPPAEEPSTHVKPIRTSNRRELQAPVPVDGGRSPGPVFVVVAGAPRSCNRKRRRRDRPRAGRFAAPRGVALADPGDAV